MTARNQDANHTTKGHAALLVALQFLSIGAILFTGPWFAGHWLWLLLEFAGIGLILWAVATVRLPHLRIGPTVGESAQLVTHGPFRWIRHPMYAGNLIILGSLVIDDFSVPRLVLWLALLAALTAKLTFEEQLLRRRFAEYEEYARRTKRLLPFVF